jgi:hypothetical protein
MKKIKLSYFISVLIFVFVSNAFGQIPERPNTYEIPQQSLYLELGGNGLIYSLNYDVLFKSGYGIRLGSSYLFTDRQKPFGEQRERFYSGFRESNAILGIIMGQKMFGKGSSKAEFGGGLLFGTIYDSEEWDFIEPPGLTFTAGYRLYPSDSGRFTFKAAFTPVITKEGFHPYFGISFGLTLTPEGNIR